MGNYTSVDQFLDTPLTGNAGLYRYILCDATQAKVEDNRKRNNERAAHRCSGAPKPFKKGKKPYHREDTPYLFPGAPV